MSTPVVKREVRLIFSDVRNNNNKFWTGILYEDGTVFTEWGRVGMATQSKTYPNGGERVLESKEREKVGKGYTHLKTVATNTSTTVNHSTTQLEQLAKQQIQAGSSPVLTDLITRLVKANIHTITSSTTIKYNADTGLFSTPLGIVTSEGISEARALLDTISTHLAKKDDVLLDAVSRYFRLIPQAIGMRFDIDALFPDAKAIRKQADILDSLEASYSALQAGRVTASGAAPEQEKVFSVKLELADAAETARIAKKYKESRQDMHVCAHLKVKRVYRIEIESMSKAFASAKAIGDVRELWHGTKKANVLSILKSGLQVSPPSTARIAGKLFGNGIYFASASTKSLNYAYGFWDGTVDNNCFMFLAEVAMGKYYVAKDTERNGSFPKKGYDSTWAKAHISGVKNDELIVYRNEQCNLTHLVEFDA